MTISDLEELSGDDKHVRKRRRGLLRMYYGVDENGPLQEENPLDIDKAGFRPQLFMEKTLKESSLNHLYAQEEKMKKGECTMVLLLVMGGDFA